MGQQSLIYSFVARGTVVLAEFTGNFTSIGFASSGTIGDPNLVSLLRFDRLSSYVSHRPLPSSATKSTAFLNSHKWVVRFSGIKCSRKFDIPRDEYKKPSHAETAEFLEDIAAGHGLQYMAPLTTTLSIDELVEYYKASNHYKDIARIAYGDDVKLTYWVDSEPGLGLAYTLYFLSKV
ncbi:putative vesicle-associated membrane protein 726 [Camellia lanceoleosa]|uniref:Vesicle-associated membrane protein 726 n=1 Tax=Camellia lanceoleosa TaxID=1840588 RepID=A0ACC0F7Q7_9ERIC|nr:putative vesicle-associated membrane protein 726 [Camellia lanceoleosa]